MLEFYNFDVVMEDSPEAVGSDEDPQSIDAEKEPNVPVDEPADANITENEVESKEDVVKDSNISNTAGDSEKVELSDGVEIGTNDNNNDDGNNMAEAESEETDINENHEQKNGDPLIEAENPNEKLQTDQTDPPTDLADSEKVAVNEPVHTADTTTADTEDANTTGASTPSSFSSYPVSEEC